MTTDAWDPAQYERFRDERRQPFLDLMALVRPRPGLRVVDLGCGTGELTLELHRHLQARETLGIDSSEAMLEKSRAFAGDGLRFERRDIAALAGEWDLVFSNAALQWVPDHESLLPRLNAAVAPGGQIAVHVPASHDDPAHVAAAGVAQETPFREALGGYVRKSPVLAPEAYASMLYRLGCRQQHVRLQVYGHPLASRDEVVEWLKGTLLTDYRRRLSAEAFEAFLARYRARVHERLADERPYFLTYKRILFWAARAS